MSAKPLSTEYQPAPSSDYYPVLPAPATSTSPAGQTDTGAYTRPSLEHGTSSTFPSHRVVRNVDRPQQLPLTKGKKSLDAVVVAVNDTTVTINCHLAARAVKLELARVIFPQELAHYGQPVRLSLDRGLGTRRLVVEARSILSRELTSIERELQAWVDSGD